MVMSDVFGFFSVTVNTDTAFCCILAGINSFIAEAEDKTVSVSASASPVPALEEVTVEVLFVYVPVAVAVMGTTMVQLPEAAIVTFEIAKEVPPLVIVTVPPQVFDEGEPAVFFMLAG